MKLKSLPIFLFTIVSSVAQGSEVIVCVPLQISYQHANNELTVTAEADEEIPGGLEGYICNNPRSFCKKVRLEIDVASTLTIAKAEISDTMIYYQTKHNAENNYGGCKWSVNM
jgi:hypothetical protein